MSSPTTAIDPTNEAQAGAWDGAEGGYWAANAERFDRSLEHYHPAFMRAAAVRAGDRVLDIGCGTGQTTRDAARLATDGFALGVDLSAEMIEVARLLAGREGIANARFARADAQVHPFDEGGFDLAVSRTGSMFFGQPGAAFANIARALRPGGRLVLLSWQHPARNEWIGAFARALTGGELPAPPPGAPSPFSQSDPDAVHALLGDAGFTDVGLTGLAEPMVYGRDADDAQEFVLGLLGWMLEGRAESERQRAADALHEVMRAHEGPAGVTFGSAAWLVTARLP